MYRTILLLFIFAAPAFALDVPPLKGRVNDYAGLLQRDRANALEQRLAAFESSTGHQIVVLTVPSLEGEPIENFGIEVGDKWKIGKKGFDNGAILIVSQKDRRLRIEVGYGLEGVLPDAIANRIIQEQIIPRFRDGDFAGGIEAGVDAIMKVTQGEAMPAAQRPKRSSGLGFPAGLILPLVLLAFFLFSAFANSRRGIWATRGPRYYGPGPFFGGGFGGGGGGWGGGGGGGFSGGGGGFGGGGASGSW